MIAGKKASEVLLLVLLATVAAQVQAGQFLVVTHASGAWTFEEADAVLVNGKEKVRSTPLQAHQSETWDAKSIGHLPDETLGGFSVILRADDGRLLARSGESAGWTLLVPDGVKSKAPQSAVELWRGSSVTLRKERKDKTPAPVRLEDLYAILPGQDPALSAARLATDTSWHKLPGMDESQAFRRMLEIIPQAGKKLSIRSRGGENPGFGSCRHVRPPRQMVGGRCARDGA